MALSSVLLLVWLLGGVPGAWAQDMEPSERDVLAFKNGDRLQGQLVRKDNKVIVFKSDRFGEITVSAAQAVVIPAPKPEPVAATRPASAPPQAPASPAAPSAEPEEKTTTKHGQWYSPAVLTAKLREHFNPWSGRLAFSTEAVNDYASRSNLSVELSLRRKWKSDEVQLKGRYDYSQTAGVTTTDLVKADGLWRHDFKKKGFALYRPSLEWSQASFRKGVPSDYVLLQQEVGAGWSVLTREKYKIRLGVSENLFDVWSLAPVDDHSSRTAESAFIETELKLPWGTLLTDRGVFYYSINSGDQGSENRLELTKKFSETLSVAVRHELRRGSPDGRAQDYTRLKLLLGLDF